ncbi:hypothetical protein CesoFtcFv8_021390 [Champsocephalus esox]|uniref:Uncharacterized protein n=1 Tax=Champsocephalus esox TaxID=159716 RepID=A0AAN8GKZ9_9TELE|nr:hypothetical protein CesoFtcFv8_021390 [Champsocephalus esox]
MIMSISDVALSVFDVSCVPGVVLLQTLDLDPVFDGNVSELLQLSPDVSAHLGLTLIVGCFHSLDIKVPLCLPCPPPSSPCPPSILTLSPHPSSP